MRRSWIGIFASVGLLIVTGSSCTNSDPLNLESAAIVFDLEPENQAGLCCVQTSLESFVVERLEDGDQLVVIPQPLDSLDLAGVGRCIGDNDVTEFDLRLGTGTWELVSFSIQGLTTRSSISDSECGSLSVCSFTETNLSELYDAPLRFVIGPSSETTVRIRVDAGLLSTCMTGMSQEDLHALLRTAIRFE